MVEDWKGWPFYNDLFLIKYYYLVIVQKNLKDLASFLELFLQSFKEMENNVRKVLSKWKLDM